MHIYISDTYVNHDYSTAVSLSLLQLLLYYFNKRRHNDILFILVRVNSTTTLLARLFFLTIYFHRNQYDGNSCVSVVDTIKQDEEENRLPMLLLLV